MSNENANPSSFELLLKLTGLAAHFNTEAQRAEAEARDLRRTADILNDAAVALRVEQEKNRQLQRQLSSQPLEIVFPETLGTLSFLIDASGSMSSIIDKNTAYDTAFAGVEHVALKNNIIVKAAIWGDKNVTEITAENYDVIRSGNLNSGSTFLPVLEYMQSHPEQKHFVILTDGDLYLSDSEAKHATKFIADHPELTIDFVVLTKRMYPSLANFLEAATGQSLATGQDLTNVTFQTAQDYKSCAAALDSIAKNRLHLSTPAAQPAVKKDNRPFYI